MLHQKLKFVVEGHLVSCYSSMLYVEVAEESLETAFQSFEVVSNAFVEFLLMKSRMSDAVMMVARVMLGHGYEPEMGLGKNNDGVASLVEFKENYGRFGLGYRPTRLRKEKRGHVPTTKATSERGPSMSHQ